MQMSFTSNAREIIGQLRSVHEQYPFSVAKALTGTAKATVVELPGELERSFDKPTDFTKRGFFVTPAHKDNLEAVVGVRDVQAKYLRWQVEGGARAPSRKALRLPTLVQLDASGNMPKGVIKQLIAQAKLSTTGKRLTKSQAQRLTGAAKRTGVSAALDLFYGDPADGRPAGIYQRVGSGDASKLVPLVVFPARAANYKRRWDFQTAAGRIALRHFGQQMEDAWRYALATAR